MIDLFAVFQSFEQNSTSSQRGQFVTDSQTVTATRVATSAATRETTRCSVSRENPRCEVCNREFNSTIQALSHFQGAAHNDEVLRRAHCAWSMRNMRHRE